jgi:tRNA (guanine37-N1)-methyltransferase
MTTPCVRVVREDGEATRAALAERDLLDEGRKIVVDGDHLLIPVVDAAAVPAGYEVVDADVPARETPDAPADLLDHDPTYERLGEVAVLEDDDPERARAAADAIVASDVPVDAVVRKASKVQGEERTREWDLLAGDDTETVHREYGTALELDIRDVYFSPRLATERHRVVEQVTSGEHVVDMFAGVGPFAVAMARAGATVVAADVNETAVEYLRANAERNGVADRVTAVHGDVRDLTGEYAAWADRLVMNLPHSADEFLDTAVALAGATAFVHYYDIQHEDDPFGPGEAAIRAAADAGGYDVEVLDRRVVRSYAPHELNVCLDVRLTRRADG